MRPTFLEWAQAAVVIVAAVLVWPILYRVIVGEWSDRKDGD